MIERTAVELLTLLSRREITSEELTGQFLEAIRQREPKVKAFLHVNEAAALEQARAVDGQRRRGEPVGPLAGIPVAIKDIFCTEGVPTTCASKILKNFVPPYDAHVVALLKRAGRCSSARPTWTNLPWARPRKTALFKRPAIPGT